MIGLLTPFALSNYGTKLQAYAVQQTVSAYGETEVIDYRPSLLNRLVHKPETIRNSHYLDFTQSQTDKAVAQDLQEARMLAISSFDSQLERTKPLRSISQLKRHACRYQAVVCGSDQIWSPVNLSRHVFMLEFAPRYARKVAFSPSFGIDTLPETLKPTYSKRLKSLDYLSVREPSGLDILSNLGFSDAVCTLDPTLVLDASSWERLMECPSKIINQTKPYLFCYFLGNRRQPREVAQSIARNEGLDIVALPHFKGYVEWDECFGDQQLYDVTAQNFIWLIRHAAAVCTDSFHGTAFSIQFGKSFYWCPRHEYTETAATNGRVSSLLDRLGLQGRCIKSLSDVERASQQPIDYELVWRTLKSMRNQTKEYLDDALGGLQ